ncbi:hypothetical protein SAMN05192562_1011346 [Kosakonia arachidis]|uniref:Uncharacterized protein n=1 Tax=Kosakonia arachidis TaxID=551989 RepID=A0A1I6ZSV8_9ENTR|nr:hypothetical protein SAMN05192562_1011346 [Kosakonia arachidis]
MLRIDLGTEAHERVRGGQYRDTQQAPTAVQPGST